VWGIRAGEGGTRPAKHDLNTAIGLYGSVNKSLHMVELGNVCRNSERLAAAAGQLVGQWIRSARRAPSTTLAP
jgi:hypothetical protein